MPSSSTIDRWFHIAAQFFATVPILVGSTVLVGWYLGIGWLTCVATGVAMRANTASCFMLAGAALLLSIRKAPKRLIPRALGLCIAATGLLTLCEYVFHVDLHIDQLLVSDPQPKGPNFFPGRMSPMTAMAFASLGLALAWIDLQQRKWLVPAELLAILVLLISGLAGIGYVYQARGLADIPVFTQMAWHTSACFLSTGVAALAARPNRGIMALLSSPMVGSVMVRRLLWPAILAPLLSGWISLQLRNAGHVSAESGLALLVAANVCFLVVFILVNAWFLNQADSRRTEMEQDVRRRMTQEHLLAEEVNHRVRNNLSAIVSLVDISKVAHKDVASFAEAINGRVITMAKIHNMLAASRWSPISLRTMVDVVVARHDSGSVRIPQDDIRIPARQASAMIMVVNELFTNSLKYGSLSRPCGIVDIRWKCDQNPQASRTLLALSWHESGGPSIERTPRPGTGTYLVNGLLRHELHGHITSNYARSGVQHQLSIELDREAESQTALSADRVCPERHPCAARPTSTCLKMGTLTPHGN